MKLAIFDEYRLGLVAGKEMVDVTEVLPYYDPGYAANFWLRMCRDFEALRPRIEKASREGLRKPLDRVRLRAPVLNPSKIIAAASNYREHVAEMASRTGAHTWLLDFDVFLKAPSSIIGPGDTLALPDLPGREIHHESELALVIGKGGKSIPESEALSCVLGYTILIDVTLRGEGDRSHRKSYDGFTPMGPWLVSADEVDDPQALDIQLWVNGTLK
ncbi:MAG: fumarylacetoacetate hydrolase family protein, partial [Candidatus Tectomicrobia bacterium]|nr:fumarylacetoacetate hydrolase family protein [Candidatus Tectomicrobia bacterium]